MKTKRNPGRKPGRKQTKELAEAFNGQHNEQLLELLKAMQQYKKKNKVLFPALSDVFHVMTVELGYEKVSKK